MPFWLPISEKDRTGNGSNGQGLLIAVFSLSNLDRCVDKPERFSYLMGFEEHKQQTLGARIEIQTTRVCLLAMTERAIIQRTPFALREGSWKMLDCDITFI